MVHAVSHEFLHDSRCLASTKHHHLIPLVCSGLLRPKNGAARDIAVIKKEECAEVVQQMWINEVDPAMLDRLETRFREILQHASFFQCARPKGDVVILVVKSSIRDNRK
eukprot:1438701-Amphidinium_carterae.1